MAAVSDLVRQIVATGALEDPAWRAAFAEVPRELFVPYFYVALSGGGQERLWRYDPDPERRRRWRAGVYDDVPLATRVRDGELISSSSQPSLMACMLEALKVRDGMRVLEVGTGPGYNAGLLAHRLGDERVVSVDLDPAITEAARVHLAAAGYRPRIVTGDGALGVPGHAPYDRVIATCGLTAVPTAWLEQCVPGALVLAPVGTGLVPLRVRGPGEAEGRFLPTPAYFVPLRGGRDRDRDRDRVTEAAAEARAAAVTAGRRRARPYGGGRRGRRPAGFHGTHSGTTPSTSSSASPGTGSSRTTRTSCGAARAVPYGSATA